eukprot:scaffold167681_cov43-Prasinocladus_malaysianus.AAC.1
MEDAFGQRASEGQMPSAMLPALVDELVIDSTTPEAEFVRTMTELGHERRLCLDELIQVAAAAMTAAS